MRISDWISDVGSSYLERHQRWVAAEPSTPQVPIRAELVRQLARTGFEIVKEADTADIHVAAVDAGWAPAVDLLRMLNGKPNQKTLRSEEHTSELQSLMRNSYAVFCLQKKNIHN